MAGLRDEGRAFKERNGHGPALRRQQYDRESRGGSVSGSGSGSGGPGSGSDGGSGDYYSLRYTNPAC